MDAIFLKLFNMSITASWLVLAVVILRIVLKKAPKAFSCLLWGLVAIRLVCPFSLESVFSLVPSAETVPQEIVYAKEPAIDSGVTVINNVVNPIITASFAPSTELTSVNPIQVWLAVVWNVWVLGIAAMAIYTLISYIRLRKKTSASIEVEKGVYICDGIDTPFILGVFKPRIFLPSAMDEKNTEYVIAHEKSHLRSLDHLWKPLGFLLLTVYWFNPVMWAAYILFCRDIELACDERVIKEMSVDKKKAYTSALLACSIPRKMISACPLAFGEVGVKQRIRSVLNYKKPAFWLIVAALVASVAVAVCFLTDPKNDDTIFSNSSELEAIFSNSSELEAIFSYSASQEEVDVVLTIPKDALPGDIYSEDGHTFEKGEVVVFKNETTEIYLTSIKLSNEGVENLYFNFDCSYNLPESGTVLLPYTKTSSTSAVNCIELSSRDLEHDGGIIQNALALRSQGPSEQFAFYVETEACKAATGTMRIRAVMNAYSYNSDEETTSYTGNTNEPQNSYSLTSALVFVGVTQNDAIYTDAINNDKYKIRGEEHLLLHKLESAADIAAFKEKFSDFQFSHNLDDLQEFDVIAKEYNDEFFKDNILLVAHTVTAGKGSYFINSTHIDKPNITFNIEEHEEDSDALHGWLLCIGLDRGTAEGVTYFDAVIERGESSLAGVWSTPILTYGDDIAVTPIATDGSNSIEFVLSVGDREKTFEGIYSGIDWTRKIFVEDLTGDGVADITIAFQDEHGRDLPLLCIGRQIAS